ncbi:hypothetical protein [Rodentibacter haemolyticus]|uniref:Uncharacterized protein n=1 Tax=Rodentibacter haemolyticus TaxID=2778911 RepID=A0ABX6UXZ4_9PAST|nr:hypothetical protein [Rodentibacter haemolyticus]QPB42243.1 hypothetical protein IHV77_10075 [Rodentibacter haemolyticus]
MSQSTQKLVLFAQAVGADIKALTKRIDDLINQPAQVDLTQVREEITQAINGLRNQLAGGELDESLDTLKEIADKLKEDSNVAVAITQKLTELNGKITALEQEINLDLLTTYNQAKQELKNG